MSFHRPNLAQEKARVQIVLVSSARERWYGGFTLRGLAQLIRRCGSPHQPATLRDTAGNEMLRFALFGCLIHEKLGNAFIFRGRSDLIMACHLVTVYGSPNIAPIGKPWGMHRWTLPKTKMKERHEAGGAYSTTTIDESTNMYTGREEPSYARLRSALRQNSDKAVCPEE